MRRHDQYEVFDYCDGRPSPAQKCHQDNPCNGFDGPCERCFYASTRLHAGLTDDQCPGGASGTWEEHCSCFETSKYCCKCGFEPPKVAEAPK